MMARGLVPEETKHNGHRRAHFHDYNRPGVYMLTLVTEGRQRLFGSIVGHTRGQRGTEEYPHLQCSALGAKILQEEIAKIPYYYKKVEVMKMALMPDHIHLLVNVKAKLPEGKHLGNIVRGFKTGCTRAWWKLQDEASEEAPGGETPSGGMLGTVPGASPSGSTPPSTGQKAKRPVLFQSGYHDRIIIRDGMPTHLTPEYAQEKEELLHRAENGAVLVTPGISKGEQGVVDAALTDHLPLILLQKEPITDYWKPPQRRFYACAAGRLLILSPWKLECDSDYARFHSLNDMARDICMATDTRLLGT